MTSVLQRSGLLVANTASLDLNFRARRMTVNSGPAAFGSTIGFGRSAPGVFYDRGGRRRTAAANVPRFGYDAAGRPLGFLVDPPAANLMRASEDLTGAAWVRSGVSVVPKWITKFGAAAGDTAVVVDSGSSRGILQQIVPIDPTGVGQAYTIAADLGSYNGRLVSIGYEITGGSSGQSGRVTFDVVSGAIISPSGVLPARMVPGPNGMWRCAITAFNSSGGNALYVNYFRDDSAAGGNGYLIAAPSVANIAGLGSYAPSTAAANGTMAADLLSMSTAAWLNPSDGTFLWDGVVDCGFYETAILLGLRGTGLNLTIARRYIDGPGHVIQVEQGNSVLRMVGAIPGSRIRVAFSYRGASFTAVKAGGGRDYLGADAVSMTASANAGLANMDIGNLNYGAVMTGSIGRVTHIPANLSADQLSQLVA